MSKNFQLAIGVSFLTIILTSTYVINNFQNKINEQLKVQQYLKDSSKIPETHIQRFMTPLSNDVFNNNVSLTILKQFESNLDRPVLPGMSHTEKSILFAKIHENYRPMKNVILHFFSRSNFNLMEPIILRIVDDVINGTLEKSSLICIGDVVDSLIANLIGATILGDEDPSNLSLLTLYFQTQTEWSNIESVEKSAFSNQKESQYTRELKNIGSQILENSRKALITRSSGFQPLVSYLLANETGMSPQEILENVMMLMFAAQETTRSVLENAWIYAAKMKDHEASEFRTALNANLSQTVKNMVGIFPPVWIVERVVRREFEIDGIKFPVGRSLVLEVPHKSPFSVGPRSCIGKKLALMELEIIFKRIFTRFRFRPQLELAQPRKGYASFLKSPSSNYIVSIEKLI